MINTVRRPFFPVIECSWLSICAGEFGVSSVVGDFSLAVVSSTAGYFSVAGDFTAAGIFRQCCWCFLVSRSQTAFSFGKKKWSRPNIKEEKPIWLHETRYF